MAFNIKNDETHRLARAVADLTGESMAQAVDTALRERMARLSRGDRHERIMEIVREARQYVPESWVGRDSNDIINEMLYDERGLPK